MSQFFQSSTSAPPPPTVATQYTENTGVAVPAANNLNVLGGTGITTSGSGNTILINVVNGGFTWIETATNLGATAQTGIFCTAALTITLPPTGSLIIGATILIYIDTSSPVIIKANTGQFIQVGNLSSTASGTSTSTAIGNILYLVFRPSDSTWHSISSVGTWVMA
jgi:hypothetical protein